MTMSDKNIWKNLDFSESSKKSAYDYLLEQSKPLIEATSGELKMDVDAVDAYIDSDPPRLSALYMLYVVAPKLGNFRRKILTVAEYSDEGRFPVDIVCHLDNEKLEQISETDFLDKVEYFMKKSVVKSSIESLYRQSKEHKIRE